MSSPGITTTPVRANLRINPPPQVYISNPVLMHLFRYIYIFRAPFLNMGLFCILLLMMSNLGQDIQGYMDI